VTFRRHLRISAAIWLAGCGLVGEPVTPAPQGYQFIPYRPPTEAALRLSVGAADAVLVGTVTRVEANWLYDDPCGTLAKLTHRCDATRAYDLTVAGRPVMVFVPHDDYNPVTVGLAATFLLHRVFALQYARCRQQAAMTSASCSATGTVVYAIIDTGDILPLADSALVQGMRGRP